MHAEHLEDDNSSLMPLTTCMQPPEKQQLFKGNTLLEDAKKLAELKVENDDVLAVTYMQEGADGGCTHASTTSTLHPSTVPYRYW